MQSLGLFVPTEQPLSDSQVAPTELQAVAAAQCWWSLEVTSGSIYRQPLGSPLMHVQHGRHAARQTVGAGCVLRPAGWVGLLGTIGVESAARKKGVVRIAS